MKDTGVDNESTQTGNKEDNSPGSKKGTSDFVVGLVTFIIFLFFMAGWMYFMA